MPSYSVVSYSDPKIFWEKSASFLIANESSHNLMLGLLGAINAGELATENPWYFALEEKGRAVGYACRSHSTRSLLLSMMPPPAAVALAAFLHQQSFHPNEILGPSEIAQAFASGWRKREPGEEKILMHQGLYECHEIHPDFSPSPGRLLLATAQEKTTVEKFCRAFLDDCFGPLEKHRPESLELAERNLRQQKLFLWQNSQNEIVAMAGLTRESPYGSTISLVYTPPEHRGRGYGSSVTAAVCQKALRSGKKFCNLYTDLKNPTSNSIYQNIGFRKLGESLHIRLK